MAEIIKEKEEIQEFLKNLGIEYRFSCYSEKNPQGCQLLGDYLSQIDNDYEKANKVYRENCDERNYGRSCSSYGMNLLNGRGFTKRHRDFKAALKYFTKACELNDATGCDFAGKILAGFEQPLLKYIEPDFEKGLSYLERGCNLESSGQLFESSESCYAAAFMYASGIKDKLPHNNEKAIKFGTKACDLGNMNSCKLVSIVYKRCNNEEMSEKFMAHYERLKKQVTENVSIEMQRT